MRHLRVYVCIPLLLGCHRETKPYVVTGYAMTMEYGIQVGDPHPNPLLIEELIRTTFAEVDSTYNNWNPDSELSQLNRLSAEERRTLSPALTTLLHKVAALVLLTEGRFDPSVAPIKQALLSGQLSPPSPTVGWHNIHLEGDQFWKAYTESALDLGGVAKGYAVDLLIERLAAAGYHDLYVSWGGEVRTMGNHPSGRAWRIAILGGETLTITSGAVATSGTYIQAWTIDTETYTHLVDPITQRPLQPDKAPIASATVLAPTCCEADALATALLLFPSLEEATLWAHAHQLPIWLYPRVPVPYIHK